MTQIYADIGKEVGSFQLGNWADLCNMAQKLMEEYPHKELSHAIIGAAMKVLNTLKPGLDEKLYENALVIELRKRGHKVDQQKPFPVFYDGQEIGRWFPT